MSAQFFLLCLFLFSTWFGRLFSHHQKKQLYLSDACTSTRCYINTVISPDDGHIVARNMYREEINIVRKIVHQVGLIYEIIQGRKVNKTLKNMIKIRSIFIA